MPRLSNYPGDKTSFHLFTASTLDHFRKHSLNIMWVLTVERGRSSIRDTYTAYDAVGCRLISAAEMKEGGYHQMVSKFLADQNRSGSYYIGTLRYKNLAQFLIDVLTKHL